MYKNIKIKNRLKFSKIWIYIFYEFIILKIQNFYYKHIINLNNYFFYLDKTFVSTFFSFGSAEINSEYKDPDKKRLYYHKYKYILSFNSNTEKNKHEK